MASPNYDKTREEHSSLVLIVQNPSIYSNLFAWFNIPLWTTIYHSSSSTTIIWSSSCPPNTAISIVFGYKQSKQNKAHCGASIIVVISAIALVQCIDSSGCSVSKAMHSWMGNTLVLVKEMLRLNSFVDSKTVHISHWEMISVGKTQKKTVKNEFCNVFVKALSLTSMKLAQDLKGPCLKHGAAVMP